ncbi:hypothetical protein CUJ83_01710 [Methanocella sp. CWC-04]|uniref:Uncharacterized protein n=1 Tax=Methanooceanicella nereidis TaxID=2052831 RepID=A0AAP2W645_9EURY|nr:hypothetical protein [Methanocella sp. CWC-04]MCD1293711.1 hypothetical protein [Methanocella sp. CWC-04]
MKELILRIDEETYEWIEKRKGSMDAAEFAGRALKEYMNMDKRGTSVRMSRSCDNIRERMDELEERINRLNANLKRSMADKNAQTDMSADQ